MLPCSFIVQFLSCFFFSFLFVIFLFLLLFVLVSVPVPVLVVVLVLDIELLLLMLLFFCYSSHRFLFSTMVPMTVLKVFEALVVKVICANTS